MKNPLFFKRSVFAGTLVFFMFAVFSYVYIRYTYVFTEENALENVLKTAQTAAEMLPEEYISSLTLTLADTSKPEYNALKLLLQKVIRVNSNARFSYLFFMRGDSLYFAVDSELPESEDYSPPGEYYADASASDKQPFKSKNALVTEPLTDKWGRWVSALVPIKDSSGSVIAVLGLDYDAGKWFNSIFVNVLEAVIIVLALFVFLYLTMHIARKNTALKKEIIERKRVEEELRVSSQIIEDNLKRNTLLIEELTETKARLEQTNSEKDKFFSIIAHDLRSPFYGLLGLSDILKEDAEGMPRDEFIEIVHELNASAKGLFKLLENLLEWSRIKNGSMQHAPVELKLGQMIQQNLDIMLSRATQKGITLNADISDDLTVVADEKMLNSVLRNLVSNAVKFTRSGGTVSAAVKVEGDTVTVSVTDTGVGIPPRDLVRLFMIEEKVSTPGTDKEPSTGLGLLLCKEFVEKNGGKIWAESEVGKGSIFHFTLPLNH